MIHALDTIMKQPLHTRLRFLFDLHDLDGDAHLNNTELKAVMDSFLEMFQRSHDGSRHAEQHEEAYLKAVSSFLTAALQMGNGKHSEPQDVEKKKDRQSGDFKLSFNEFLLAVLSQSVFVEYFERKWTVNESNGRISATWRKE